MRLRRKSLRPVNIYRAEDVPNGYVGHSRRWTEIAQVQADVQPADDELLVSQYGELSKEMWTVLLVGDVDIEKGDGLFSLSGGNPTHIVESCKRWESHTVVVARPYRRDSDGS